MSESGSAVESERELRWRAWQEKSRRSNQRTERQMRIVFWTVAVVFLFIVILYCWSRAPSEPKILRPVVAEFAGFRYFGDQSPGFSAAESQVNLIQKEGFR